MRTPREGLLVTMNEMSVGTEEIETFPVTDIEERVDWERNQCLRAALEGARGVLNRPTA
jgi:hypothetical protein